MSGPLRLVPEEGAPGWAEETMWLRTLPRRFRPEPEHARQAPPELSADPIDALAERLTEVCADAVHPYEIAAFLEADGLTDEQAALHYGRPDSFTLAEELFAKVDRRYPGLPPASADPWRADPWRCVLRGLVFALPGLGYLLGADLFSSTHQRFGLPSGMAAMAVSTLTGWAWNQAVAHRAYSWLGRADRRAAARSLAVGAPAGALLAAGAGYLVGGPAAALWFIAGQAGYLAAATVLLVLGKEHVLLFALAPSVAGGLLVPATGLPSAVRTAVLLCTLGCAVALAGRALVACLRGEPARAAHPAPFHQTLPAGLFGLAVGTLTMVAALGETLNHAHRQASSATGSTGPAVAALTLGLGLAEWLLYRYRSLALRGLRTSHSPRAFRRRACGLFTLCLLGYLAATAALDLGATALWPGAPAVGAAPLAALLLLAATLWTALLLQAFGLGLAAALVCAAAAGYESAALAAGAAPVTLQLTGCGAATAVLALVACVVLGRTTTHR